MADTAPASPVAEPSETPWALAQRLTAQGLPPATVRERLAQAGLSPEDVTTLLRALSSKDEEAPRAEFVPIPSSTLREHAGSGLALGMGVAMVGLGIALFLATSGHLISWGLVVGGLLRITASFMQVPLPKARPQRPVEPVAPSQPEEMPAVEVPVWEVAPREAEDGAQRCQVHPQFASVGTCSRCGAFACTQCAPQQGVHGTELCASCERQPMVHQARVKTAARRLAVAVFVEALLVLGFVSVSGLHSKARHPGIAYVILGVVMSLPFAVLALVQWAVRHPWPGILGAAATAGCVLSLIALNSEEVPAFTLLVMLAPMVAMLFLLERLIARRKAQRSLLETRAA